MTLLLFGVLSWILCDALRKDTFVRWKGWNDFRVYYIISTKHLTFVDVFYRGLYVSEAVALKHHSFSVIVLKVSGMCFPFYAIFSYLCFSEIFVLYVTVCRSQWPLGLRRRSELARLLKLWVWIPRGTRMSVCCECCVLSGRAVCDELITCPEESYRLWCVVVCDLEDSWMRRLCPIRGLLHQKQTVSLLTITPYLIVMWLLPLKDYRILCTMNGNFVCDVVITAKGMEAFAFYSRSWSVRGFSFSQSFK
jgi:hypothetical protein